MFSTPVISVEELLGHPMAQLVDVRTGPGASAAYDREHLRGAVRADLNADLSAEVTDAARGGRHPLPELQTFAERLGRWGIGPDTTVVAYDDRGGALAAARLWWMLRAVGHQAVSVLSGGYQAAAAAGLPRSASSTVDALPPYPVPRDWLLPTEGIDEVATIEGDAGRRLIDARAPDRYRGESEPINPVAGHIPGARNFFFGNCLDASGRFLPSAELAERLRGLLAGVSPERVTVSCGSGVTACHILLALEHAGLPGASLYVGSWSEWCRSGRPVG